MTRTRLFKPRPSRSCRTTQGLTLIELVVALGIFALVAIMGVQSLSISLNLRDQLSARAAQANALGQGIALLRNDLSAVVPLLFYPPGKAAPRSALRPMQAGRGFSLSLGGQPALTLPLGAVDAAPKQRVDWRLDPQTARLTRSAWPTLYPLNDRQKGPEVPALEGVTGLSFRSYWTGQGWVPGLRPPEGVVQSGRSVVTGDDDKGGGIAPEVYSSSLPRAVEITLDTRDFGQIVLMEYFQ